MTREEARAVAAFLVLLLVVLPLACVGGALAHGAIAIGPIDWLAVKAWLTPSDHQLLVVIAILVIFGRGK
jgi:hypothetical protein